MTTDGDTNANTQNLQSEQVGRQRMTSKGERTRRPMPPAATALDSVQVGDTTIEYEVRRSARRKKTVQIRVDSSGVKVAAPAKAPREYLQALVRKRASWILKQTASVSEVQPLQFVSGESLAFLGRNVPLVIQPADVNSTEVSLDLWSFQVTTPHNLSTETRYESIRLAVVGWYKDRAAQTLESSVDRWWPLLGRGEKSRVLIRDQRHRWASCSYDGTLRFNWRVMMLEPPLIEYIVVHELAHLTHRNHSKDFWTLVYDTVPEARDRRRRLREAAWPL